MFYTLWLNLKWECIEDYRLGSEGIKALIGDTDSKSVEAAGHKGFPFDTWINLSCTLCLILRRKQNRTALSSSVQFVWETGVRVPMLPRLLLLGRECEPYQHSLLSPFVHVYLCRQIETAGRTWILSFYQKMFSCRHPLPLGSYFIEGFFNSSKCLDAVVHKSLLNHPSGQK